MVSGIYKAIDAGLVHQLRVETVSNNLANINTSAFKKDVISFQEALNLSYSSNTDFGLGPIKHSGNELDLALEGPGFFKIQTGQGIRYTRNGIFSLDSEGQLVTPSGDAVLGDNGPVRISGGVISIGRDGQIVVDGQSADRLMVVDFEQRDLLKKEGSLYFDYQGEESEIYEPENINVQQHYLEGANVNPTEEMIKLMEALRGFESAQKALQSISEMTNKMINDVGLVQ